MTLIRTQIRIWEWAGRRGVEEVLLGHLPEDFGNDRDVGHAHGVVAAFEAGVAVEGGPGGGGDGVVGAECGGLFEDGEAGEAGDAVFVGDAVHGEVDAGGILELLVGAEAGCGGGLCMAILLGGFGWRGGVGDVVFLIEVLEEAVDCLWGFVGDIDDGFLVFLVEFSK